MKANYRVDRDGIGKNKMVLSKEDIGEYLNEEWEEKKDQVYTEVKRDVSAQILSVFFTVMCKEHGWKKKRLLKLKSDVEAYFALMQTGVFNKTFTPVDCIEYIKDEFGIDLDKEEIIK